MGTPAGQAPDRAPLFVMSVDIDTEDATAFDGIVRTIPQSRMQTKGKKGWKAFYRPPFARGGSTMLTCRPVKDCRRLVNALTGFDPRQSVVSPSIHPNSGG